MKDQLFSALRTQVNQLLQSLELTEEEGDSLIELIRMRVRQPITQRETAHNDARGSEYIREQLQRFAFREDQIERVLEIVKTANWVAAQPAASEAPPTPEFLPPLPAIPKGTQEFIEQMHRDVERLTGAPPTAPIAPDRLKQLAKEIWAVTCGDEYDISAMDEAKIIEVLKKLGG